MKKILIFTLALIILLTIPYFTGVLFEIEGKWWEKWVIGIGIIFGFTCIVILAATLYQILLTTINKKV